MYDKLNGLYLKLCKTSLKLKVITIISVMCQHFSQETLKQLDMDFRPTQTLVQNLRTLRPKSGSKLLI